MAIRSRSFDGEPKGPTPVLNLHMTEPAFKAGLERLMGEDREPTGTFTGEGVVARWAAAKRARR